MQFLDGTNVQHLLEMGLHVIIHVRGYASVVHSLKGIQSVTSIQCLIRVVLPRSRSLWANRCSHLSSSSLACSCSALGHSPRPWRSRPPRAILFGVAGGCPQGFLQEDHWWYLVGRHDLPNHCLGGVFNRMSAHISQQMGTQDDPRCLQ